MCTGEGQVCDRDCVSPHGAARNEGNTGLHQRSSFWKSEIDTDRGWASENKPMYDTIHSPVLDSSETDLHGTEIDHDADGEGCRYYT